MLGFEVPAWFSCLSSDPKLGCFFRVGPALFPKTCCKRRRAEFQLYGTWYNYCKYIQCLFFPPLFLFLEPLKTFVCFFSTYDKHAFQGPEFSQKKLRPQKNKLAYLRIDIVTCTPLGVCHSEHGIIPPSIYDMSERNGFVTRNTVYQLEKTYFRVFLNSQSI